MFPNHRHPVHPLQGTATSTIVPTTTGSPRPSHLPYASTDVSRPGPSMELPNPPAGESANPASNANTLTPSQYKYVYNVLCDRVVPFAC